MSTNPPRSLEARRIIACRREAEGGDRAGTWHGHEPSDLCIITCQLQNLTIEIVGLLLDGLTCLEQRPDHSNNSGRSSISSSARTVKTLNLARPMTRPTFLSRPRIWFSRSSLIFTSNLLRLVGWAAGVGEGVCAVGYNGYIVEWQPLVLQSSGALDTAAHRRTEQLLMPLVLFLLLLSLVIYFIPIYLLRRRTYARAQDYFVSSGHTPPGVIRNSSVAYALKLAIFGPFFVWGASGDFWPAIINSACFGLGVSMIYILRRPLLAFLDSSLSGSRSMTVHEFIARQHGNDQRVRLLASGLTIFAILALTIGEALVLAAFLKPVLSGNAVSTYAVVCGLVALMAVYAIVSGNSGVMRSAQSQLGMCYLGLFGAAALLLYLMISALRPMSPHSTFAIVFVAACCAIMPFYRRSRYMDTGPIRAVSSNNGSGGEPFGARLFRRFEKILNDCMSVFAAWVIVLAAMEIYLVGISAAVIGSRVAMVWGSRLCG